VRGRGVVTKGKVVEPIPMVSLFVGLTAKDVRDDGMTPILMLVAPPSRTSGSVFDSNIEAVLLLSVFGVVHIVGFRGTRADGFWLRRLDSFLGRLHAANQLATT